MRKNKHLLRVLISLDIGIILFSTSCFLENKSSDVLSIVSWNVQNLFNASVDGYEYGEYLPSSGWTEKAYQSRLANLSRVCSLGPLSSSDVFIFNEVENDSVVEDTLNLNFFKKNSFQYYATAGELGGAIKTAIVSKIPIVGIKVHSLSDVRPILQVELQNEGERIFILAIHAKSNLEGVSETANYRLALATTLKKVSSDIEKENPDALILIAGDFNESYENKNMMSDARDGSSSTPLQLLPDFKRGYLYCFWLDSTSKLEAPGSYCYKGDWNCYDNIMVSYAGRNGSGWEYETGGVVFQDILQTTDNKPNSFRRDLLTGVSDHLPVWVQFTR